MKPVLDPEGAHLAALRRLGDFRGRSVLELGCGDGRLTLGIATDASSVLAPGGRLQIADVTIQQPVSAEGRRNIDLWTG